MTGWPSAPVVYEVDTWPWLSGLRRRVGAEATLADVPGDVWDEVAAPGTDAVWLMGVWERSPLGLAIAGEDAALRRSFLAALPDLTPKDVVGSPYSVRRYVVDARLGGPPALARALRVRLQPLAAGAQPHVQRLARIDALSPGAPEAQLAAELGDLQARLAPPLH